MENRKNEKLVKGIPGCGVNYVSDTKNKDTVSGRIPIKRGCKNEQCFCTGKCNDIIGWRDKLPEEV